MGIAVAVGALIPPGDGAGHPSIVVGDIFLNHFCAVVFVESGAR